MDYDPAHLLFPVRVPTEPRKEKYAREICGAIERLKVGVVPASDKDRIISFATA